MECNIESKVMGDLGLAIQFHLEYEPAAIVLEGDQLDFDDRAVILKRLEMCVSSIDQTNDCSHDMHRGLPFKERVSVILFYCCHLVTDRTQTL